MMIFKTTLAVAVLSLTMVSCGEPEVNAQTGEPVDVTVQKLNEVANDMDDNTIVLDVRTPGEVAEGTIDGAGTIDYNGNEFEAKVAQLDKTKTYYVYCRSGGRSSNAVEYMQEQGFTNVHNVLGGYNAYTSEGFAK